MATTKEYKDFVLEALRAVPSVTAKPMMGEWLVYSEGVYVGGIAGSNYGYGAVKNCINYAMVTGGGSVGQICGQLTSTSSSENCSEKGSSRLIG